MSQDMFSVAAVEDVVQLDVDERVAVRSCAQAVSARRVQDLWDERALVEFAVEAGSLPRRLLSALIEFRLFSSASGYLLIRGIPVDDDVPSTPASTVADTHYMPVASSVLAITMSAVGDLIGYADEKGGRLLHDICPMPGEENKQENTGSVFFDFHTENAFHPFRPDVLGLVAIRPDHENRALTVVASGREAFAELNQETLDELMRDQFRTRLATSFTRSIGRTAYGPQQPVISGSAESPDLCVDFHNTQALTPRGAAALGALKGAVERTAVGIALNPGDLLLVDNRKAVHGRTTFVPRYDGRDRWLQRMFAVADLRASDRARPSRSHVCSGLLEGWFDYGVADPSS